MRIFRIRVAVATAAMLALGAIGGLAGPAFAAEETGTLCTSNTGTVKLRPGLEETTPKVQNVVIKGVLTGCEGSVSSSKYVAHLKTAGPATCATLAAGEVASGTIVIKKWSPKGTKTSHGSLELVVKSGSTTMFGSIGTGGFEGDGIYSPISTVFAGEESCGDKKAKVKLGSLSSSELRVAAPPDATIETPENGGVYHLNEVVPTSFSCNEGLFGPGLESCIDSNGSSSGVGTLDTSTLSPEKEEPEVPGELEPFHYSAIATSIDHQKGRGSIHYLVIE